MEWVVLKTDLLFFLLLVGMVIYAWSVSVESHLATTWKQVATRPLGMAAASVFSFFLLVAFLDSLHFEYSVLESDTGTHGKRGEVLSALDIFVTPIRVNSEKTYSAPFAFRSYAKEAIEMPDGSIVRDYPRLLFGGAHLQNPTEDRLGDILTKSCRGALLGLFFSLVICIGTLWIFSLRGNRGLKDTYRLLITGPYARSLYSVGIAILVMFCTVSVLASLAPYYHVFGTDKVGGDVLYQGIKSIRTGLLIGTLTTLVMLPFAIFFGVSAGYFGGWVDDAIQYVYTTLASIPGVLLIAASALILDSYMTRHAADFANLSARADVRLIALCMILGVTSWTGLCRYLRGEVLKLRELDYITAAQAFGVRNYLILLRHILPNIMHIVMISIVLDFSGLVLAEAALTYINIGVDPTMESWGNMINSARLELAREPVVWWSLTAAFVFMFLLVLAANIFADTVRDAFDPRIRKML